MCGLDGVVTRSIASRIWSAAQTSPGGATRSTGGASMSRSHTGRRGGRRAVLAIVVLTLLAVVVAATASFVSASSSPSPGAGKVTLRLGWSESPLNLNPFIGYSNSYEIWLLNYDTLVAVGADGLPSKETGLAEDWELSPDEKDVDLQDPPGREVAGRRAAHGARRGLHVQHHHRERA